MRVVLCLIVACVIGQCTAGAPVTKHDLLQQLRVLLTSAKHAEEAKSLPRESRDFYDICDQVSKRLGYPCEHVNVTTHDGFVLDVIRLPSNRTRPYPVYLQHGLVDTAATFVMNALPSQNLACMLHDAGYDVWMNNVRGNHYSMRNLNYTAADPMYWMLQDMDEMASFDLPAVYDKVLATTGSRSLTYVGHSQGGMMGFAAFSTSRPAYAAVTDLFIGLAPACYVSHATSAVAQLLGDLNATEIELLMGNESVLTSDYDTRQAAKTCPYLGDACAHLLGNVFGFGNDSNINETQLEIITRYDPGGTSVSNLIHWSQLMHRGVFAMHDFGPTLNEEFYHQLTPPEYNITAMTAPRVAMFFGGQDGLVSPADAAILTSKVPAHLIVHNETIAEYNHMEFVWGMDAHIRLYPTLLSLIAAHREPESEY